MRSSIRLILKKLFSHKLQLIGCAAAGVLFFLSFRYDWYGYDRFIPKEEKIASAGLELSIDENFMGWYAQALEKDGKWVIEHKNNFDFVKDHMQLTDMDTVLSIVNEGVTEAAKERNTRFSQSYGISVARTAAFNESASARSVSVIGGADGPTAIFVAGKTGSGEADALEKDITVNLNVFYTLKNGKQLGRRYNVSLNNILDAYHTLYASEEYKKGLYPLFEERAEDISSVIYKEAGSSWYRTEDSAVSEEVLRAYQTDLLAQRVADRRKEDPVGSLLFIDKNMSAYLKQQGYWKESMGLGTNAAMNELYDEYLYESYDIADDYSISWPVYPSFKNTIEVLKQQICCTGKLYGSGKYSECKDRSAKPVFRRRGHNTIPPGRRTGKIESRKSSLPGTGKFRYYRSRRDHRADKRLPGELPGRCQWPLQQF